MLTKKQPEIEWMQRIANGDAEAFCLLVDAHMARSIRFAGRLCRNPAHAEDVVQEAFEAIWKNSTAWTPSAKFSTWLYKVICNIASRRQRDKLADHAELDDDIHDTSLNAEDVLLSKETNSSIADAVQALPDRQRQAIGLFYFED